MNNVLKVVSLITLVTLTICILLVTYILVKNQTEYTAASKKDSTQIIPTSTSTSAESKPVDTEVVLSGVTSSVKIINQVVKPVSSTISPRIAEKTSAASMSSAEVKLPESTTSAPVAQSFDCSLNKRVFNDINQSYLNLYKQIPFDMPSDQGVSYDYLHSIAIQKKEVALPSIQSLRGKIESLDQSFSFEKININRSLDYMHEVFSLRINVYQQLLDENKVTVMGQRFLPQENISNSERYSNESFSKAKDSLNIMKDVSESINSKLTTNNCN